MVEVGIEVLVFFYIVRVKVANEEVVVLADAKRGVPPVLQ
jgi:hypothetical protein